MARQQRKQIRLEQVLSREPRREIFDDRRVQCIRRAKQPASDPRGKDKRVKSFERRRSELNRQRQDNWWLCVGYVTYGLGVK